MKKSRRNMSGVNRLIHPINKRYDSIATKISYSDTLQQIAKIRPIPEDTLIRREVHNIIIKMLQEGKGKLEILTFLNEKYHNSFIRRYFGQYIEDCARKIDKDKVGEER